MGLIVSVRAKLRGKIVTSGYALSALRTRQKGICETQPIVIDDAQQPAQGRLIDQRMRIMTFAVTNTQAPLGAVTILHIVDGILSLKNMVVSWNDTRVTRKALLNLSDDGLEDIGLCRADLYR